MKTCPTCGNIYTDDLSFCLQDGTKLPGQPTLGLANRPTEVLPQLTDLNNAETIVSESNAVTPQPKIFQMSAVEPSTRMGCALSIGQVAAGLIVVVGLGFVGIFLTFNNKSELVQSKPGPPSVSNTIFANSAGNASANSANVSMNASTTPQTSATSAKLRTISGGVLNTKAIEMPEPIYPPVARAARASGSVSVQVLVDETGRVVSATALSGHPLLRHAAEQAARSARFSPTLLGGESVKVSGVINYNFVL